MIATEGHTRTFDPYFVILSRQPGSFAYLSKLFPSSSIYGSSSFPHPRKKKKHVWATVYLCQNELVSLAPPKGLVNTNKLQSNYSLLFWFLIFSVEPTEYLVAQNSCNTAILNALVGKKYLNDVEVYIFSLRKCQNGWKYFFLYFSNAIISSQGSKWKKIKELYSWFWCGSLKNSEIIKNSDLLRMFVHSLHKLKGSILFVSSLRYAFGAEVRPAASCSVGVWWLGAGQDCGFFPALLTQEGLGCADGPLPPAVALQAWHHSRAHIPCPLSAEVWL